MWAAHFLSLFRPALIWVPILRDYRRPRQLILPNGAVMSTSSLQLVEVNQTTFTQWPNSRVSPCWARVWTCLPPPCGHRGLNSHTLTHRRHHMTVG